MKIVAQIVASLIYLAVALVQWSAEVAGLRDVLGWPSFLCWLVSMFTAWIPVIGTAAGIWGARAAWDWGWIPALLLFLGVPFLGMALVAIGSAIDKVRFARLRRS